MEKRDRELLHHANTLLSALVDVHNATVKFEVLANEVNVHKGTKEKLKKCLNECRQIRQRFDRFWGEVGKRTMDEQILSDEDTLQVQNIQYLTLAAPKGIRNQIETYAEGLVNVYTLNKNKVRNE